MIEKLARSNKYQITIAELSLAKEVDELTFEGKPVNAFLVRALAPGDASISGTGIGEPHGAFGIMRSCIRRSKRGRFFNVVALVKNWLPRPC
ncbi:hypothetical protein [Thioclava sp. 'Guangxiensis']|uniref:hypothetical protein n=1 Tax=unclassified Thioclava TaxID=2621713 RepID=UPI00387822DA